MMMSRDEALRAAAAVAAVLGAAAGAGAIGYGLYLAWPPLAWVFLGALLWRGARTTLREEAKR